MKYIRAVEPEDLDLMYVLENDHEISLYTSTTVPLSRFALKRFIEETSNDLFVDGQVRLSIVDPSTDATCGFLDITHFSPIHHRAEVGIVLMESARGKGLATEVLNEVSVYAQELGLHQLYAVVYSSNLLAHKVFLRAGYKEVCALPEWIWQDGKFVDAILFQLLIS